MSAQHPHSLIKDLAGCSMESKEPEAAKVTADRMNAKVKKKKRKRKNISQSRKSLYTCAI